MDKSEAEANVSVRLNLPDITRTRVDLGFRVKERLYKLLCGNGLKGII